MKTLKECILTAKEKYREDIFIKSALKNYTYDEIIKEVLKWSGYLMERGIKKGDRVGIITPKSIGQLKSLYAVWMAEGIIVPINENSREAELKFILEDSTPKVILTISSLEDKIKNLYPEAEIILLENLGELSENSSYEDKNNTDSEDIGALIYTSGSTGNPKGVMLTHKNLISNGKSIVKVKELTTDDCLYSILPYWHSFSLAVEVIGSISSGLSLGFTENPRNFVGNIPLFKPTIILAVPRILEMIKGSIEKQMKSAGLEAEEGYKKLLQVAPFVKGDRYDFTPNEEYRQTYDILDKRLLVKLRSVFGGKFREFISGGAALDINLQRYFGYLGLPVMQGYGLSETSPVVSVDSLENYSYGSSGDLLEWLLEEPFGNFTFLDETGNRGKDLKGELLLKGSCVMKGYWNHRDESAKVIKDGWLHTGDIGYYKDEKLYISGRKTNMIVLKGGENIHPEFIENELKKSDIIDDVMVIGDGCKNLYACLTVPENYDEVHESELNILLKSEVKRLTSHLVSHQKPRDILLIPRFTIEDETYTGTMKVRRHMVNKRENEKINNFLEEVGER
ncbi:AMP-binding protein [Fusobacteria bacterium ZRK30]|nr:AMP-binding protein [Fusobacteria bacterium ZRK30]